MNDENVKIDDGEFAWEDLMGFCAGARDRDRLAMPRLVKWPDMGGFWWVATNGWALVAVPEGAVRLRGRAAAECEEHWMRHRPVEYWDTVMAGGFGEGVKRDWIGEMPERPRMDVEIVSCPAPGCESGWVECNCPDCPADNHLCSECGGHGLVNAERFSPDEVLIEETGQSFRGMAMWKVLGLRGVRMFKGWTKGQDPAEAMFFFFDADGAEGVGAVMPVRK